MKKKRNKILLLILLLLAVSVGYALLSTTLKINGSSTISKNTWEIYWDNVGNVEKADTVTVTTPAEVDVTDVKQVNFNVALNLPGDYYEFQVDAVNNGTIDAMIESIQTKINGTLITATPSPLPSYVSYSITYADGTEPVAGHLLAKKTNNVATRERYKVRIEFLKSVNPDQLPSSDEPYEVDVTIVYKQADDTAVDPHATPEADTFADDSWDTIKEEGIEAAQQQTVTNGKCGAYNLGDTKTIQIDADGDNTPETYTVRIANCSTPAICSSQGFSQTTCGFVVEFTDEITTHRMNPYVGGGNPANAPNGNGNKGGWEYSDMRAYLNGGTFTIDMSNYIYTDSYNENINYSSSSIYSRLPQELKDVIKNTTVVSGGSNDAEYDNFTTQDKLYLLSPHEIFENTDTTSSIYQDDKSFASTRQLDYYALQETTADNPTAALKKLNGAENHYWLRTALYNSPYYFHVVYSYASGGGLGTNYSHTEFGISPAFRIG